MESIATEIENLAQEIETRARADWENTLAVQRPKNSITWEEVEPTRKENTEFLKQVIEKHGWPKISVFGRAATHWAWYIVQHSDDDVKFQEKCLELMEKLPPGEKDLFDQAYLTDRVRANNGQPQVYGTQYWTEGGERKMLPVIEPDQLQTRRKRMGLDESFQEHHERMTK